MTSIKTKLPFLTNLRNAGLIETTDAALMMGAKEQSDGIGILSKAMTHDMSDVLYLNAKGDEIPAAAYAGTERFAVCPQMQQPIEVIKMPRGKEDGSCVLDHQVMPLKQVDPQTVCLQYGAFPQTVAPRETETYLTDLFKEGGLKQTENHYTIWQFSDEDCKSERTTMFEYEYRNRRYVPMMFQAADEARLSNGSVVRRGEVRWLEVQPIQWTVHPKTKVALSRKALLAGLDWGMEDLEVAMYNQSGISHYLATRFDKEMMQSHQFCKTRGFAPTLAEKAENQASAAKAYATLRVGLKQAPVIYPRLVAVGKKFLGLDGIGRLVRQKQDNSRGED